MLVEIVENARRFSVPDFWRSLNSVALTKASEITLFAVSLANNFKVDEGIFSFIG